MLLERTEDLEFRVLPERPAQLDLAESEDSKEKPVNREFKDLLESEEIRDRREQMVLEDLRERKEQKDIKDLPVSWYDIVKIASFEHRDQIARRDTNSFSYECFLLSFRVCPDAEETLDL